MDYQPKNIADLREDYRRHSLEINEVSRSPHLQFDRWFQEAMQSQVPEPNAMTLATASLSGRPSARIVLLKGYDEKGFIFYTNYESRKGKELLANPQAALVFCWLALERQIRIEGSVSPLSKTDSERYFQSRPRGSQIGAWASPQSQVITDRQVLEDKVTELDKTYAGKDQLPIPPNWGGFILQPDLFEFWQGRSSRLHDRICYTQQGEQWTIERLAP